MVETGRRFNKWKWLFWAIMVLVIVPGGIFSVWVWGTLKYTYSNGQRAGFVQKFSKKGWLCKSWEGELAMVNLPGTVPEIFSFSVRNDSVVKSIQESMGQRVVIEYDQHRGVPTSCFGETEYFVVAIHPVAAPVTPDAPPTSPAATPAAVPTGSTAPPAK